MTHTRLTLTLLLAAVAVPAQTTKPDNSADRMDTQIALLRKDIRDQKKLIVAANLSLTTPEAEKFWPLYTDYTLEMIKVNDMRYAVVKDYAINFKSITDDLAANYIRRWVAADGAGAKLRLEWIPKFEKALGEKKAAMFFQLDYRLELIQQLQIASELPLIEP